MTILRRSLHPLLLLLALASLGGCAGLLGRSPESREVAVTLPVSRDEAVRRTLAAFRREGYRVRETLTSGLEPESEPFRVEDAEVVFRAAIAGSGRESRVVLTGTYRRLQLMGVVRGREEEVHADGDELERALWRRLQALGAAVRDD